MSSTPKTTPKKLRGGAVIAVDNQLIRWRKRLEKEGIVLGKNSKKQDEINRQKRKEREVETPEKLVESFKKKFGG